MEKYVHACDKGIDWCLQYLKDDGSPAMPEPCFDSFYKFPAALNVMGKHREAASLLNWIEMKTLIFAKYLQPSSGVNGKQH